MDEHQQEIRVGKFFTRSRKIPVLIGRLMDGSKIWGGPYTILQVVIGAVTIFLMWQTNNQGLWGLGNIIIDMPLCLGVGWGAAWASGRIPSTRRNLLNAALSTSAGFVQSRAGIYKGKPLRVKHAAKSRPKKHHQVEESYHPPQPSPQPGVPSQPPITRADTPPHRQVPAARTSLEAILAQARTPRQ